MVPFIVMGKTDRTGGSMKENQEFCLAHTKSAISIRHKRGNVELSITQSRDYSVQRSREAKTGDIYLDI